MPIMSNVLTSIEGSDLGAGMTKETGAGTVKIEYYKKLVECGPGHFDCV